MSSADDIEEISLEVIPTGDDRGVQIFITEDLQEKLLLKQFNLSIKRVGMFLYIATLAMAQKSEYLIKVQNALLDNLKLNDTSAVMLQSFQSGAVNIVEKLKVAYLYLLDGFPEFAKTDIEAIGKDINTMKDQANKTKKSTAACAKDVKDIKAQVEERLNEISKEKKKITQRLQEEQNKKPGINEHLSYQNRDKSKEHKLITPEPSPLRRFCLHFCCCLPCVGEDSNVPQTNDTDVEAGRGVSNPPPPPFNKDEAKVKLLRLEEEEELFRLTFTGLEKASVILIQCHGFLDQLLVVVKQWYTENKEVVSPSMAENIRRTEGMSEAEMQAYWESLMFRKEVQKFYTRWVALKLYCESTRKNLKQIRAETEAWYVDNPRPRDAVQKAWAIARNADDEAVDRIVKSREMRLADQSATPAITY